MVLKFTSILIVLASIASVECTNDTLDKQPLTIAAASNLRFAFDEIEELFSQKYAITVNVSYGSSGNLSKQVENGAPYDIFFSANKRFLVTLRDKGLLENDTMYVFIKGRLVLGVRRELRNEVSSLNDLLKGPVKNITIASPDHAPYGIAAKEVLVNTGLWQALEKKLVFAENIRQTILFIETGNADAGIITGNIPEVDNIIVLPIDDTLYSQPEQYAAITKNSKAQGNARKFLAFLKGEEAAQILDKYNYSPSEQQR